MGPIGCPETSVRNYHYLLRNNSARSQFSSTSRRKPEITHSLHPISVRYILTFSCHRSFLHVIYSLAVHHICSVEPWAFSTSPCVDCSLKSVVRAVLHEECKTRSSSFFFTPSPPTHTDVSLCRVLKSCRISTVCCGVHALVSEAWLVRIMATVTC